MDGNSSTSRGFAIQIFQTTFFSHCTHCFPLTLADKSHPEAQRTATAAAQVAKVILTEKTGQDRTDGSA